MRLGFGAWYVEISTVKCSRCTPGIAPGPFLGGTANSGLWETRQRDTTNPQDSRGYHKCKDRVVQRCLGETGGAFIGVELCLHKYIKSSGCLNMIQNLNT